MVKFQRFKIMICQVEEWKLKICFFADAWQGLGTAGNRTGRQGLSTAWNIISEVLQVNENQGGGVF